MLGWAARGLGLGSWGWHRKTTAYRVSFRVHRHPPGPSGTNGRCFCCAVAAVVAARITDGPRVCINLRTTQLQALQTVKSTNLPTNTARIATVEDMGIVVVSFLLRRGNSKSAFHLLAHLVLVIVVVVVML